MQVVLGVFVVTWLLAAAASPARAAAALSALPFWPAAPMVIATTLGVGVVGKRGSAPKLAWGPSALSEKLPRFSHSPTGGQTTDLLRSPPALSAQPWSEWLPEPPGFAFENGPRSLVVNPNVRVTRSGAFLTLQGTF